jgi:hypothetical protein
VKAVWKYPLEDCEQQTVRVPRGSKALSVLMQRSGICLYVMVETDAVDVGVDLRVWVYGTGAWARGYEEGARFVGTVQAADGGSPLVQHVFVEDR